MIHDASQVAKVPPFLHLLLRNATLCPFQSSRKAILALELFFVVILVCFVMQVTELTLQILANSLVEGTSTLR